jgi:hypothetical protein
VRKDQFACGLRSGRGAENGPLVVAQGGQPEAT